MITRLIWLCISLATAASTIAYGAFDVRWWVPTDGDSIRGVVMFYMHAAGLFAYPIVRIFWRD